MFGESVTSGWLARAGQESFQFGRQRGGLLCEVNIGGKLRRQVNQTESNAIRSLAAVITSTFFTGLRLFVIPFHHLI